MMALANLCQLFAATVGEDDVKLFVYHVRCDARIQEEREEREAEGSVDRHSRGDFACRGTSISNVNHSNLENGGERWGERLGNKQSRRIRNMQSVGRIPGHIL